MLTDLPAEHTDTVVVRRPTATQPTLVVQRETPARPPRPARRRRRPRKGVLWALVALLLAAAALGGGWYLGSGRYTEAPSVLGLAPQAATEALVAAGLEVVVAPEPRNDEDVATGLVLEQDPGPDSRALRGSTVTLVLSAGPDRRAVPELAGNDVDGSRAALEQVGLVLGGVTEEFSDQPVGAVLRSDPGPGAELRPDTQVALVVSKGLELLDVPAVVGRGQQQAAEQLEEAGFTSEVREVFSETVERGVVLAQTPADGQAPRGSVVQLDVSRGPQLITVPDLGGSSREQAEQAIEAAGLEANINARPGPGGAVRFQEPGAGDQVRRGTTVTVFVF